MTALVKKQIQLVIFELSRKLFGIEVNKVQEVIKFKEITPAPGSLNVLEGIVDVRGEVVPVVDLRKRFQMEARFSKETRILIAEVQNYLFGFIVDRVEEVGAFVLSDFTPAPPGTNQAGSEYTVGVTHRGEQLLLYLDVEHLIDADQLLQEVA